MAAIIDGLNGYIQNRIRSFGSRSFFVSRIPPGFTGLGRLPAEIRLRKYPEIDDAQFLKQNIPGLDVSAGRLKGRSKPSVPQTCKSSHSTRRYQGVTELFAIPEGLLGDFLHFIGADAGSAHTYATAGAVNQGANTLQIQIPAPLRDVVGMADTVTENGAAATQFANSCHKTQNSLCSKTV